MRLLLVHGDIRHLENCLRMLKQQRNVHGDIRHLENVEFHFDL